MKSLRTKYFYSFIILFFVEFIIAKYVHSGFVRSYLGDVLIIPCFYCGFRIIFPIRFKHLAFYTYLLAVFVEFLQLININKILHFEDMALLNILIGTVFDINDIISYTIGFLLIILFYKLKKLRESNL